MYDVTHLQLSRVRILGHEVQRGKLFFIIASKASNWQPHAQAALTPSPERRQLRKSGSTNPLRSLGPKRVPILYLETRADRLMTLERDPLRGALIRSLCCPAPSRLPSMEAVLEKLLWAGELAVPPATLAAGCGYMIYHVCDTFYGSNYNADAWALSNPAYFARRGWISTHWFAGIVSLCLVAFQLFPPLRRSFPAVHRWTGRIVLLAVACLLWGSAPYAFTILDPAPLVGVPNGDNVGELGLTFLWIPTLGAASMTLLRARQRDFAAHRRWALRLAVLLLAAPIFRLLQFYWIPSDAMAAGPGTMFAVINWLCWVPFSMALEVYLGAEVGRLLDQVAASCRVGVRTCVRRGGGGVS